MISTLIGISLLALSTAIPTLHQGRFYYNGRTVDNEKITEDDKSYTFTQQLDHFDRQDSTTFEQRYFLNTTYWKGSDNGAPVFFCVGGEGPPLDYTVLVSSVHCNDMVEIAYKYDALLVALEHRYYGPSNPFDDFSTEHLKWMSTEQALGDIASFHSLITEKYELTANNRWITFGGSYPGMLAGFARLKFPNLFFASVSSSSPMQAQVDMVGYNDVVANSMTVTSVGGSEECLAVVVEGHKSVGSMLESEEGKRALEEQFNVCGKNALDDPKNAGQFAGDGVVYLPIQSNDPACTTPLCNIDSVCTYLLDETHGSTPVERLVSMSKVQHAGSCIPASYDLMLRGMANEKNPERSWLYQTCTEYGFYQTCQTGSECPYTQGLHTLETDYDICLTAFNMTQQEVDYEVQYTNSVYGGDMIQGTRILYPNGEIDPWHALGVLKAPNAECDVLPVAGASHHFWTHPSLDTDSAEVNEARQVIWNQVDAWLHL